MWDKQGSKCCSSITNPRQRSYACSVLLVPEDLGYINEIPPASDSFAFKIFPFHAAEIQHELPLKKFPSYLLSENFALLLAQSWKEPHTPQITSEKHKGQPAESPGWVPEHPRAAACSLSHEGFGNRVTNAASPNAHTELLASTFKTWAVQELYKERKSLSDKHECEKPYR